MEGRTDQKRQSSQKRSLLLLVVHPSPWSTRRWFQACTHPPAQLQRHRCCCSAQKGGGGTFGHARPSDRLQHRCPPLLLLPPPSSDPSVRAARPISSTTLCTNQPKNQSEQSCSAAGAIRTRKENPSAHLWRDFHDENRCCAHRVARPGRGRRRDTPSDCRGVISGAGGCSVIKKRRRKRFPVTRALCEQCKE